jgi:hypothetical protein
MKPLKKVSTTWSPNLAYIVGLIATDGSLSKDGRHISFTSKDAQLINTFKKCLGIKNKIGLKSSGFGGRKYPYIQFGDVNFYKWLLGIGLTPNKSRTLGELKIPNKYFFDFLRGHFDGDGCCYGYWDPRWHSSFMFYTTFISASEKHVVWLKDKIEELLNIKSILRKENGPMYGIRFAKKDSKTIFCSIYYKEKLPHLSRKFKKFKKILEIENKENSK